MKKILFINILFVTTVSIILAQEFNIVDNFNNNDNEWLINDAADYKSQIINGKYIIENKMEESGYRFWNNYDVSTGQDFVIETKLKQTQGNNNMGFGLMWHSNGTTDNHNFEISSTGYYRILYRENEEYVYQAEWTKSEFIKGFGLYNTLKIEKKGSTLSFYINDNLVHTDAYSKKFGNNYGFILRTNMKIFVDNFKIQCEERKINIVEDALTGVEKENLGLTINSPYSEIIPVVSADGRTLYVTRSDHPGNQTDDKNHDDIWFSELGSDGTWGPLQNIGTEINNEKHNFTISISPDNNTMMINGLYNFFGEGRRGNGISIVHRTSDFKWGVPSEVKIDSFYNDNKYQNFTVSPSGKVIVMSIERTGDTYGDSDLYVSFRKPDGSYSVPLNMGATLNTVMPEGTPYVAADGVTLYFNSEGHPGYGNADIFVSKRLDDTWTNWSEPKNMGPAVNTNDWDAYFTLDAKAEYAYLVSSNNTFGEEDIFRIKISEESQPDPVVIIYGKVYNKTTKALLGANIYYEDLNTGTELGIANSNPSTGEYKIVLPYGKKYGIVGKKTSFMPASENIDLSQINEYTEIEKNLYLVPIFVGEVVTLNNLFFKRGKAELEGSSYPELDRLIELMKNNPKMKIEIYGHTNNIGPHDLLVELSKNRAITVKQYLVTKGISEKRIKAIGIGPDKPVVSNDTPEGRTKNQRVEFKITKK